MPDSVGFWFSCFACDPRFVALLIGRRGWNVKHIQSESGASINIDQNVDPPKIKISGKSEQVKKAEQLVRDVLKYATLTAPLLGAVSNNKTE